MAPEARDKHVETVGRERWKKAAPKVSPEVTPSAHFLLFGTLPKDRAAATLKVIESQSAFLRGLLSQPGSPALERAEKTSLYVFNDANSFVEFVRSIKKSEVEPEDRGVVDFSVFEPYIAVVDPLGGREDAALSKKAARPKRDRGAGAAGSERSLAGLLAEQLAIGATEQGGKPPRWLTLGLGAYCAARIEPRSQYVRRLRDQALDQFQRGWPSHANEAMGGEAKVEGIRAVGFGLIEFLSTAYRPYFPAFVRGMLAGTEKLDDVIEAVLKGNRGQFLDQSGQWIAAHYERPR
jgi:hypothetical protein